MSALRVGQGASQFITCTLHTCGLLADNADRNLSLSMIKRAASSEFVSSSIPSWQILSAHAQPFRGARDLAFCLKVLLDSMLLWASSGGSGETARMRRLVWPFAARIGDKNQIRLTRPKVETIHKLVWNTLINVNYTSSNYRLLSYDDKW